MKKIISIFSLILFTTFSYSQSIKTVKIDSLVSVSLPATYIEKDTLGQQTFSANTSFGYVVVTRIPNAKNNAPLKKEKDLKTVFKDYAADVKQVGNGTIQNERDTTVGSLKGRLFTLRTDDGNGSVQFRRFLLLYTQEVTYTFQYFYDDIRSELITSESKAYFSSIKLSPELRRNDQYLAIGGGSSLFGISQMALYGSGLVIVLIVFFTVMRRRKRNLEILD